MLEEVVKNFKIIIPKVVAKSAKFVPSRVYTKNQKEVAYEKFVH
jgi:superfamily II DNA/RNA helicase